MQPGIVPLHVFEAPLRREHREQDAVGSGEHLDGRLLGQHLDIGGIGGAGHRVGQRLQLDRRAESRCHPVAATSNCIGPDRGEDRGLVAASVRAQHLDHALLVELVDAALELLVPRGILGPGDRKCSGEKLGIGGKRTGSW